MTDHFGTPPLREGSACLLTFRKMPMMFSYNQDPKV